jgi:hypothetical protein
MWIVPLGWQDIPKKSSVLLLLMGVSWQWTGMKLPSRLSGKN